MAATLTYETKTCGRCGGSGHYSFNLMHGTVCYGCSGRKTVLTAAGSKASLAVKGFIEANYSVAVRDLTPGMLIRVEGVTRRIVTAEFSGSYGASNGVPYESWSVTVNKPIKSAFGAYSSMGLSGDAVMVRAVSGADWEAVIAFARTIKKGVTVVEPAAPAEGGK